MPWAKLDDHFHDHAKVITAGHEAIGLFALTLTWACGQQTDGKVPAHVPQRFAGGRSKALCQRLVEAGLFDVAEEGWVIHDFLDYNPSRARSEQVSEVRAEAGRKGARARWADGSELTDAMPGDGKSDGKLLANEQQKNAPSRPVPTPSTRATPMVGFDNWYRTYPKHVGRGAAERAYRTALKATDASTLLRSAEMFAAHVSRSQTDPKFIPNPTTWLNQGRWDDDLPEAPRTYDPHDEWMRSS